MTNRGGINIPLAGSGAQVNCLPAHARDLAKNLPDGANVVRANQAIQQGMLPVLSLQYQMSKAVF